MWKTTLLITVALFALPRASSSTPNPNNILFERFEFQIVNQSAFKYYDVQMKTIAPNILKYNLTGIYYHEVTELWMHFILYYKYKTYQKFLIDLWENVCESLNSKLLAPVFKLALDNIRELGVHINFKWKCPFPLRINIYHPGLNMSHAVVPLLPAGRYRFNVSFALQRGKSEYLDVQVYFAISDLRVFF